MPSLSATVISLLALVELSTNTVSAVDGNSSSAATSQNVGTVTTMFQDSSTIDQGYENSSSTFTKSPVDSQRPSTDLSSSTSEGSKATGLRVLYRMSSTFLDVIQPPGKNLYDELGMESALAANPNQPLQVISQSLSSKARSDPKYFIRYWVGFAVCVAFGVVFIVLMPIVGLCVCVCRCCCHRCGHEKTGTPENERDKPKRICLGILLFFLTIVILAGTVCAFMSNELVRQQTSSENSVGGESLGLVPTISRNLGEVDAFKQATVKEVDDLLIQMNNTLYKEVDKLNGLPEMVDERLRDLIGTDLIGNISTLSNTLVRLVHALKGVDADSRQLGYLYSTLNQSLTTIEGNLSTICHPPGGNTTLCNLPDLTKHLPDPNQMPNVSSQLTSIESIVSQGINVSVFEDISRRVRKELQSVLDAVSRFNISGTLTDISLNVKSAADSLNLKPLIDAVNGTKADVDKYGSYRFNVCVAISALLLLIVLLLSIGLCIGVCSKPSYDVDSTSGVTRWTGHFFMASVVIMFIFCSVLMVIVTVLFVSGGIVYSEGCRGFDQQTDNALVKIADSLLRTQLGNVSLYGILRDCKNDAGIVKALNLDEKFNLSSRFNLSNLGDLDVANRINTSAIDFSHFQLDGPKTQLENLRNSSLTNINFTVFNELLNNGSFHSTLTKGISDLNTTAQNTSNVKSDLQEIVRQLQNLSETIVVEIDNKTEHIRLALKVLNETLYVENSKPLTEFLKNIERLLERTENRTKYDAPRVLQQLVNTVSFNIISNVKKDIEDARTKVLTSVGRCSPLSNAIEGTVAAVCHSTLDPYNAFWFSYGWCVFLFIPTIAVAVVLARLCWRIGVQPLSYSEQSGYDAYKNSYPEEYLRLHNLTTSQQDLARRPGVNGTSHELMDSAAHPRGPEGRATPAYSANPGYVDYGDSDRSAGNGVNHPNNNNGIDFYREVGRHGNGSYDNPTYSDNDSSAYRIPRPTAAHARDNSDGDNGWKLPQAV